MPPPVVVVVEVRRAGGGVGIALLGASKNEKMKTERKMKSKSYLVFLFDCVWMALA